MSNSDQETCGNAPSGAPDNFTCNHGETCYWLAANTTLLCCPENYHCYHISPINCDLTLQNATSNPTAPIKTTELHSLLTPCGELTCCPFGYSCNENTTCGMNENQDEKPVPMPPMPSSSTDAPMSTTSSDSKTTSSASITTGRPLHPEPTTTISHVPSTSASLAPSDPTVEDRVKVIVPAAVAGVLAVTLAAIGFVFWTKKRASNRARRNTRVIDDADKARNGAAGPTRGEDAALMAHAPEMLGRSEIPVSVSEPRRYELPGNHQHAAELPAWPMR